MVQRGRKDLIPLPDYKLRNKKNEKTCLLNTLNPSPEWMGAVVVPGTMGKLMTPPMSVCVQKQQGSLLHFNIREKRALFNSRCFPPKPYICPASTQSP